MLPETPPIIILRKLLSNNRVIPVINTHIKIDVSKKRNTKRNSSMKDIPITLRV